MSGELNKWGGWVMTGKQSQVTFSIWKTPQGYNSRLDVTGEGYRTEYRPTFKSRDEVIADAEPIVRKLGVDTSGMTNAKTKLSIHGWRGHELDMMSQPEYNPDDHIAQAQFVTRMRGLQKDVQAELDKRLPKPPPPEPPPEPKDPADWWKESVFDREDEESVFDREDEPGPRVTFIGGIRADDGTVKVVKDIIVDYEGWLTGMDSNFGEPTRKTHANLGMRGSKDGKPLWIKFRACEGTCFWWEQPTLAQKKAAVVAAGGPPVTEHMFISSKDAYDWIDRLTDRKYKPRSPAEYAWQRAHYESSQRVTFIGGISDTGKVKLVKAKVGDFDNFLASKKTHYNLGMRGNETGDSNVLWTKFRACEGTCFWWERPTAAQRNLAHQSVLKAGGQAIGRHVVIEPEKEDDWIDRLMGNDKPRGKNEYAWQRAHYESSEGALSVVKLGTTGSEDEGWIDTWEVRVGGKAAGKFEVAHGHEEPASVESMLVLPKFRGLGYARNTLAFLAQQYGVLTSSQSPAMTNPSASRAWLAAGGTPGQSRGEPRFSLQAREESRARTLITRLTEVARYDLVQAEMERMIANAPVKSPRAPSAEALSQAPFTRRKL